MSSASVSPGGAATVKVEGGRPSKGSWKFPFLVEALVIIAAALVVILSVYFEVYQFQGARGVYLGISAIIVTAVYVFGVGPDSRFAPPISRDIKLFDLQTPSELLGRIIAEAERRRKDDAPRDAEKRP